MRLENQSSTGAATRKGGGGGGGRGRGPRTGGPAGAEGPTEGHEEGNARRGGGGGRTTPGRGRTAPKRSNRATRELGGGGGSGKNASGREDEPGLLGANKLQSRTEPVERLNGFSTRGRERGGGGEQPDYIHRGRAGGPARGAAPGEGGERQGPAKHRRRTAERPAQRAGGPRGAPGGGGGARPGGEPARGAQHGGPGARGGAKEPGEAGTPEPALPEPTRSQNCNGLGGDVLQAARAAAQTTRASKRGDSARGGSAGPHVASGQKRSKCQHQSRGKAHGALKS